MKRKDENGNLLALNIRIANKTITLITIYAPNADSPVFFENVSHILDEFNNDDIILVGDYNLVIDPQFDSHNYLHVNNPRSRNKVLELIEIYSLIDIYRQYNPTSKRFTWRRNNPYKTSQARFFSYIGLPT